MHLLSSIGPKEMELEEKFEIMDRKRRILVTGGHGFIGGNFIRFLKDNFPDSYIVNIDKNGYASNKDYIKGLCDEDIKLNLKDSLYLENVFLKHDKFDYIFHFAAESHVDNSISGPTEFVESNVLGTQNLLECYRKITPHARFIHISTDEVYGHLTWNEDPFTEKTPIAPRSPYSASKASSDLLCLAYIETYNLDISITRCCNNYGPNQHNEKFLPTIINALKDDKKIPVYGDGTNVREWMHVHDHTLAVWTVATRGKPGVYNIGSGNELSNLELVDMLCKIFNKDIDDCVKFVEDRLGHDFRYAIDNTKLKEELLWEPMYNNMYKELEEYVEYFLKNGR